jgi:uncharacterized protein YjbJ (UPF0337 family)
VLERFRLFEHVGFFFAPFSQQPQPLATGDTIVGGKTDEVKGRIKEAVGAVTDNDKLRVEGQTDQAVGKVKQVANKAVDKVKQAVEKLQD